MVSEFRAALQDMECSIGLSSVTRPKSTKQSNDSQFCSVMSEVRTVAQSLRTHIAMQAEETDGLRGELAYVQAAATQLNRELLKGCGSVIREDGGTRGKGRVNQRT